MSGRLRTLPLLDSVHNTDPLAGPSRDGRTYVLAKSLVAMIDT